MSEFERRFTYETGDSNRDTPDSECEAPTTNSGGSVTDGEFSEGGR